MQSQASTVLQYCQEVPKDQEQAFLQFRATIKNNLPDGFEECMNYGML